MPSLAERVRARTFSFRFSFLFRCVYLYLILPFFSTFSRNNETNVETNPDGPLDRANSMDAAWMAPPSGPWTIRVDHAVRRREIEATSVSTAWLARLNAAAGPRLRPDTRASSSSHFRCTDTTQRERERESVPLRNVSLAAYYASLDFLFLSLHFVDLLNSSFLPFFSSSPLPKSIFRPDRFKLVSPGQADLSRSIRH